MAKYRSYDYSQEVLIPVSLEQQLMPGTLEFAVHTLVETRLILKLIIAQFHSGYLFQHLFKIIH